MALADYKDRVEDRKRGAYAAILAADPKTSKIYAPWLIEKFLNGRLPLEDMPNAREYLKAFHRIKPQLPNSQKDIRSYADLSALYNVVAPHLPKDPKETADVFGEAGCEVARNAKAKRQEVLELYRGGDYMLLIPLSMKAAIRYGRGTKWCVGSTRTQNRFYRYASEAPLFILITKDELGGRHKYAFHFGREDQIRDERDGVISNHELQRLYERYPTLWDHLEPYVRAVNSLEYVPTKLRTKELCEAVVQERPSQLQYVPDDILTREMCAVAVLGYPYTIRYVPWRLFTKALCERVIKRDGRALEYFPPQFTTEKICLQAVSNCGTALEFVPDYLRTKKICWAAVNNNGHALAYVPEHILADEMCLAAARESQPIDLPLKMQGNKPLLVKLYKLSVGWDGRGLEAVPKNMRSYELCLCAMKNGGRLAHVPYRLRTEEMCMAAVHSPLNIKSVPRKMLTEKMCKIAVQVDGTELEDVPLRFRTDEVCRLAFEQSSAAYPFIPKQWQTEERWRMAFIFSMNNGDIDLGKHAPLSERGEGVYVDCMLKAMTSRSDGAFAIPKFDGIPNQLHDSVARKIGLRFDERGQSFIERNFEHAKLPEAVLKLSGSSFPDLSLGPSL